MLSVKLYPIREVPDEKFKFAVIMARTGCGWLYCCHRERQTWEIPGGHREGKESIKKTAARELYEESGAEAEIMEPICAYSVTDDDTVTYGALFFAEVSKLQPLPDSEIAEAISLDNLPDALTYPEIQPILFTAGVEFAASWDYTMSDVF
jgi:8-oxo-dGTP diphosphatase